MLTEIIRICDTWKCTQINLYFCSDSIITLLELCLQSVSAASVPVIGVVPDDEDIVVSANQGEPLVDTSSLAGEAYLNICRRISGESVPFMDLDPHKGILVRISGFLKRA